MRRLWERGSSRLLRVGIACSALVAAGGAHAQPPNAADEVAADALFTEARQLLDAGRAAEACPKLEESRRLDPVSEAALNLGKCYELIGRTASAYVAFGDAATLARRSGDSGRAEEAERRVHALAPKLVRLAVNVPDPSRVQGLEVFRDGQPLAKNLWGTAIPVDPGEHFVEARAPERVPWKREVKLDTPGTVQTLEVPKLPPRGKTVQRAAGIVVGSLGIAALGVAGGITIAAAITDEDSKEHCLSENPNKCFPTGFFLRNQSIALANTATVLAISGGVALATGATLFFLVGTSKSMKKAERARVVLPYVSPEGAGVAVGGLF